MNKSTSAIFVCAAPQTRYYFRYVVKQTELKSPIPNVARGVFLSGVFLSFFLSVCLSFCFNSVRARTKEGRVSVFGLPVILSH